MLERDRLPVSGALVAFAAVEELDPVELAIARRRRLRAALHRPGSRCPASLGTGGGPRRAAARHRPRVESGPGAVLRRRPGRARHRRRSATTISRPRDDRARFSPARGRTDPRRRRSLRRRAAEAPARPDGPAGVARARGRRGRARRRHRPLALHRLSLHPGHRPGVRLPAEQLDTVLGSLVGNPWTLPPFFAVGYRVGRALLGYAPRASRRSSGSASCTRTSGSLSAARASVRAWRPSSSARRFWPSSSRSPSTGRRWRVCVSTTGDIPASRPAPRNDARGQTRASRKLRRRLPLRRPGTACTELPVAKALASRRRPRLDGEGAPPGVTARPDAGRPRESSRDDTRAAATAACGAGPRGTPARRREGRRAPRAPDPVRSTRFRSPGRFAAPPRRPRGRPPRFPSSRSMRPRPAHASQ